ncbi:Rha family transcriptional regulator [Nitrosomonas halophila]|uniref:Phage regulatory protein, rha family n=1 Tax=Nitrosomonas halophila TaxID=44576 RepID=A0A1H3FDK6_9PROT|nr:Rha family transcriptional regulator [Nitrosomonas halophila]SDX89092.1 phage regulatory protein, rha family [Nitrosomonas halophila]
MNNQSIVTLQGDQATTNTLIVAEYFGKEHKHVMRDLRSLMAECAGEFNRSNFGPVEYYDAKGERRPMYTLTKKSFMLLAMGFTGINATRLKIAFIDEFERMETALKHRQPVINEAMREELLKARPLWAKIAKYDRLGLSTFEICLLIQRRPRTLREHRRRMQACGLLARPDNRPQVPALTPMGGEA